MRVLTLHCLLYYYCYYLAHHRDVVFRGVGLFVCLFVILRGTLSVVVVKFLQQMRNVSGILL